MGKKAGIVARHILALAMGAKTAHEAIGEHVTLPSHKVTWLDHDGRVIDVTDVRHGAFPEHDDPALRRPSSGYDCVFADWVPPRKEVTENTVYRARYLEIDRSGNGVVFGFYNHVWGCNCRFVTYYSDSYFDTPSVGYDPSLTTFSMALALSSGHKSLDASENADHVRALLGDIGCGDIRINDYYLQDRKELDKIGVAIGVRYTDIPTVFVVIKGCYYGAEFAGNLIMGSASEAGGRHKGFAAAKDYAMGFIRDTVRGLGLYGRIRMLVTGYSRAGAVTNLVSSNLTDMVADGSIGDYLGVELSKEDLYGFCYEPALCQTGKRPEDDRYDNIICVMDSNDPVVKIPPALYDFTVYGRIILLDSNNRDVVRRMLGYVDKYFGEGTSSYYNVVDFVPRGDIATLGEMLDDILRLAVKSFGDREYYVKNVQEDLAYTVYEIADNLNVMRRIMGSFDPNRVTFADVLAMTFTKGSFIERVAPYISDDDLLSGTEMKRMTEVLDQVIDLIKRFSRKDLLTILQELRHNYKRVITPHYPLGPLSYLMSDDPNYRM